jgi:hypothetical protein
MRMRIGYHIKRFSVSKNLRKLKAIIFCSSWARKTGFDKSRQTNKAGPYDPG